MRGREARAGGAAVCRYVCVDTERGWRPALRRFPGPTIQIDLNFRRRVRAGGGAESDPDRVTPAAFIHTVPYTHISADATVCSEKSKKKIALKRAKKKEKIHETAKY